MQVINIAKYQVIIGEADAWTVMNNYLFNRKEYSKVIILVDHLTKEFCLPLLLANVKNPVEVIQIPAGEANKSIASCQTIWSDLIRLGADRNAILINLGGGMVGDLGGFCASTYLRGIEFIQMPTTVLSMVDASVGGKLGMDYPDANKFLVKNAIGLFKNPLAVIIIPSFLKTLPEREVKSGFAEIIKHALIADARLWKELLSYTTVSQIPFSNLLGPSIEIKKSVVSKDPKEKGLRKMLNFGHTIGHALETRLLGTPDQLLHGEAVAAGMICESYLSNKAGFLSKNDLLEITDFILRFYKKITLPESAYQDLIWIMERDKKNEGGKINFTLIKKPGEAVINQTFEVPEILESLMYFNQL